MKSETEPTMLSLCSTEVGSARSTCGDVPPEITKGGGIHQEDRNRSFHKQPEQTRDGIHDHYRLGRKASEERHLKDSQFEIPSLLQQQQNRPLFGRCTYHDRP